MIVLSLHATLTGAEEKKTGPSRFRPLFLGGWVDTNSEAGSWEPEWLVYRAHTGGLQPVYTKIHLVYTNQTLSLHGSYTRFTRIIHSVYSQFTVSLHGVYTRNTPGAQNQGLGVWG
jgi:hypothetical protein